PVVAGKAKEPYSTFYQVFVSEGAFGGKTPLQIPRDLVDGTSNTFLVVEAGDAVPWTKPVDVEYRADKPVPKLRGLFEQGFHVAIADGDVCFFRKKDQRGKITDAGVKEIVRFKSLRTVYLGKNSITDAGLKMLRGLPKLEGLELSGNQITDAGLKEVKE